MEERMVTLDLRWSCRRSQSPAGWGAPTQGYEAGGRPLESDTHSGCSGFS